MKTKATVLEQKLQNVLVWSVFINFQSTVKRVFVQIPGYFFLLPQDTHMSPPPQRSSTILQV